MNAKRKAVLRAQAAKAPAKPAEPRKLNEELVQSYWMDLLGSDVPLHSLAHISVKDLQAARVELVLQKAEAKADAASSPHVYISDEETIAALGECIKRIDAEMTRERAFQRKQGKLDFTASPAPVAAKPSKKIADGKKAAKASERVIKKVEAKAANREVWLRDVADHMAPWFADLGYPLPKVRIAIGFTSKGMRGKRIGECWSNECSGDDTHEIFIVPTIDDSSRVGDILAHELVHAAVGLGAKHGKLFGKVARAIGLEGKLTATVAGAEFTRRFAPILEAVGPMPHAALSQGLSTSPKKQATRMLKCECSECGYTVRTTAKWLELAGAPICPTDRISMDAPETDDTEESDDE